MNVDNPISQLSPPALGPVSSVYAPHLQLQGELAQNYPPETGSKKAEISPGSGSLDTLLLAKLRRKADRISLYPVVVCLTVVKPLVISALRIDPGILMLAD
jgi:hypothetical protein